MRTKLSNAVIAKERKRATEQSKRLEVWDTAVPGLFAVVSSRGTTFYLKYRGGGGQQRKYKLGTAQTLTIDKARREAKMRIGLVAGGEDPQANRKARRAAPAGRKLEELVDEYIAERSPQWKRSTTATYLSALGTFGAWGRRAEVILASDLTPDTLANFRAYALKLPCRVKKTGGGRHDTEPTGEKRSAHAINCELRAVKTMLQVLRVARRLPGISSSDDIRDNVRAVPVPRQKPMPMKPATLKKLLAACARHDAETFAETRDEHRGLRLVGTTPRFSPLTPLVVTMLLSGLRLGEALALAWDDVDVRGENEIRVRDHTTKTARERAVDLSVSPALGRLLAAMRLRAGGVGRVFDGHTEDTVAKARRRVISEYGAPSFLWSVRHSKEGERSPPTLRSTCGCYLAGAPGIFGGASVFMSAAQLGHSVQVAERHYLGALKRIPKDANTLEAAMQLEHEVAGVVDDVALRATG